MKKYCVLPETALKLKKLGFNEQCFGIYYKCGTDDYVEEVKNFIWIYEDIDRNKCITNSELCVEEVAAPLFDQVQLWLLDKYKLSLEFYLADSGGYVYRLNTTGRNNTHVIGDGNFEYLEAKQQGYEKTLDRILAGFDWDWYDRD